MATTRILRPQTAAALLERACLVAGADPPSVELARLLLAPLLREDGERQSDLIATLRAYYVCGMRVDRTADKLFLHRNSVRYRLDRVRALLRMDVDEPSAIAALSIALKSLPEVQEKTHAS